MRFLNLLGNKAFAGLMSAVLGQYVKDTLCGTKALRADDYRRPMAARGGARSCSRAGRLVRRERSAWLASPLSGGFTGRRLLPLPLAGAALALDRAPNPLIARLGAYRTLIVLERG